MKYAVIFALISRFLLAENPIRGFPKEQWEAQRRRERQAAASVETARIGAHIRKMSGEPHHAGSAGSRAVAEYALDQFRSFGLDAQIEPFEALLPYPKERVLELVSPGFYQARLAEPALPEDPDSADADQLPTYNAYSAAGDVTAELVYVNYGLPEDYAALKRQGIDVRGKIVIARYGRSWRGTKPKVAYENGAAGCLIYSDPQDDGYYAGDVYPKGPYRPPHGVQRGSVMDMPVHVGDPLSPGWASEPGARKLRMGEAATLMKIPVLPISYEDARPLLGALEGPVAPEPWRGALPLTYHLGPGPGKVRLKLAFDFTVKPVYNVLATIRGADYPDQWVIYGNHHDAWVNGADDPASGAAALLETARAFGDLLKQGWKPKRTVVFALWDAEEFGLVGSTEWVEKHKADLERYAVAYLNSDSNGPGTLGAGGSYAMEAFLQEIAAELRDPESAKTLLEEKLSGAGGKDLRLTSLGAGSDYVAFMHHTGIASMNLGFSGRGGGGIYHSIYDSFRWYTNFSDRKFVYGKALSELMGTALMRLLDAPVLPFEFGRFTAAVREQLADLEKRAGGRRSKLDFPGAYAHLRKCEAAAKEFESRFQSVTRGAAGISQERLAELNERIYASERVLIRPEGLPGRPWYKHQITAPGLYTGYGAKTLPGVREAVEAARWDEAAGQMKVLAETLDALAAHLGDLNRRMAAMR